MSKRAKSARVETVTETFEKELDQIKEFGKELKGDRREFFNSIVQRVENNKQALQDLREEHTKMREYLKQLTKAKTEKGPTPVLSNEIKKLTHQSNFLKKQVDNLRHKREESVKRQNEIKMILQSYRDTNVHGHPEADKIQDLKNKLDNANTKNAEAQYLLRVYEQIEYLLDRQKVHFTPEMQKQIDQMQQKYKDVEELTVVTRDSKFSRLAAKNELIKAEKEFNEAKRKRDAILLQKSNRLKELTEQTNENQTTDSKSGRPSMQPTMSMTKQRMTKNKREKKEEEFRKKQLQLENIREVFGTTDPEAISKMISERKSKAKALEASIQQLNQQNEMLSKEEASLKQQIEEIEFNYSKGVGANRIVAEGSQLLREKREELHKLERSVENIDKMYRKLVAGISYFPEVLQLVVNEDSKPPTEAEQIVDWTIEKVKLIKVAVEEEDYDLSLIVNKKVVAANMKKKETKEDLQKVDSSKKQHTKRIVERFRANTRDPKGEITTRVQDRNQVKALAAKAKKSPKAGVLT